MKIFQKHQNISNLLVRRRNIAGTRSGDLKRTVDKNKNKTSQYFITGFFFLIIYRIDANISDSREIVTGVTGPVIAKKPHLI